MECSAAQDQLLQDVAPDADLASVDALLSAELGNAMRLSLVKQDGSSFGVLVPATVTVRGLKAAVTKKIDEMEEQELGYRHLSWKHVWSNFCLCYGDLKLAGDSIVLRDVGVKDGDKIGFGAHLARDHHSRAKRRRLWRH